MLRLHSKMSFGKLHLVEDLKNFNFEIGMFFLTNFKTILSVFPINCLLHNINLYKHAIIIIIDRSLIINGFN